MISIDRPLLIAHRTAMGLCPENTIVGIEAAIGSGVDGVEIDVRVTRDGVPVLMHDASLDRTTGDARDVEAVTLGELRELSVIDPHGDGRVRSPSRRSRRRLLRPSRRTS